MQHWIKVGLSVFCALSIAPLGCVSASGEVEGTNVGGMKSGFWIDTQFQEGDEQGSSGSVAIYLYDFASSCSKQTAYLQDTIALTEEFGFYPSEDTFEDYYDGVEEIQREHLPAEYWMLSVGAYVDDFDDLAGSELDLEAMDEAGLNLIHQKDYWDYPDELEDAAEDNSDWYWASSGTLTIQSIKEGGRARGQGDATLTDYFSTESEDMGDLSFSFDVAYCEGYREAMEDYFDLIPDAV